MRRKTFDMVLTAGGAVLAVVLIAAGALGMWGYNYANTNVHNQLAAQQITFPALGSAELASPKIGPFLDKYAGQQLLNGQQAEAYADHFIAVHLSEMPLNGVYAAVSGAARTNPTNAALQTEVQTVFQGTTLRGLLLEAYAFWTIGQVALVGAVVSFILAFVMLLLTALGIWHFRRTPEDLEFPNSLHTEVKIPAGV
ncbi:MAG TPA: hypothetical protein VMV14_11120 [Acidimicrobiales bacterium]|nr:hypothetical protein [Acidimicrobiales bacterium]